MRTLTIWGPDFRAPLDESPGGAEFRAQLQAFEAAHPGWRVEYVRKKPYGQGGIVHFLKATHAVAPELLPDLVLVDMSELGLLADASLLQPLDSLLGAEITSDLMGFAREAGEVDGKLLALQDEAELRFLAYNSALIAEPPSTWAEVLATRSSYLMPIGATEGAVRDAFLPQYLAVGGKLVDREGQPYLDAALVKAVLEVYQSARDAGLLLASGLDLKDASDCWPVYLASRVAMTNVSSWDYGRERTSRLATTRVGPLPTLSGNPISVSSGWGWALISTRPERQKVAAELLQALLRPEAMAARCRLTYQLPTRRSALRLAIGDTAYLEFLERLIEVTVPQPREPAYGLAIKALGPAIESVARGEMTPEAAAAQAVEAMRAARQELASGSQS
ncbi:MAG: extracellular solute-binding protein [Anaerolineae bacterium]|nr:extracellular solute-binding protein [Anaerolineae bacterium]